MCSERTSAALEARRARGHRLGAKPLAEEQPETVVELRRLYATGEYTHVSLAAKANELALTTKHGGRWHATTVARTLRQRLPE
jgi:DNA invertase Pin-like site-specific DNA recombinase